MPDIATPRNHTVDIDLATFTNTGHAQINGKMARKAPCPCNPAAAVASTGLEDFTAIEQHLVEYVSSQFGTRPLDAQTDNQATTAIEGTVAAVRA